MHHSIPNVTVKNSRGLILVRALSAAVSLLSCRSGTVRWNSSDLLTLLGGSTYVRHRELATAHRGNSIDSLNFGQLNLNDGRPRRPSQPATSSSYMSPSSDIRRPDSRSQHNASPYSQHSTPAAAYAAEYQATHPSHHPAYAQRLSYDDHNVDRNSELAYADPQQQNYGGQDYYANSGQYAPSTSLQPYNDSNPASVRYSDGYTEEPAQAYNPYFAQGQQQYDTQGQSQYDQNAAYYAQNDQYGYDQYAYDQAGPSQQSYNNQAPQYAGSNSGGYGTYSQQAYPGQSYGSEYPIDPPRAASGSFSQGLPANVTPLNRNKTTVSAKSSLSIDKSQSTQPITKQAVDDYRNRIKSDPDPETQFNFARFLIEAARRLAVAAQQGSVDDAKSVKKYRDALLQEAIKLVKRLATQGSGLGKPAYADAQFFLANCLGHGALGLSVDHEKAYNLYVQASKQNHPAATYRTAVCNEVGAGTRRDAARAVLFYRKASALGDTAGMYKLGMILLNGLLGQQKNPREAVIWLKKAAAQADEENPHALHELGSLYEKPVEYMQNGQPVPSPVVRDEALARDFYTQAAQLGHAPSQCKLGACYEYGNLTCPVDPRRSIAWYTVSTVSNRITIFAR